MRLAVLSAALLVVGPAAASADLRRQPTSIAFWDARNGVLATVDWNTCRGDANCRARLVVTGDGGRSWRVVRRTSGPLEVTTVPGSRVAFAYSDRSGGWYAPGVLLKTTDGGRSWRRLAWRNVTWIAFATPRVGWVVRGRNRPGLFATGDGGATWRRLRPCGAWELYVALPDSQRGWAVCAYVGGLGQQPKRFVSTSDGGRTWRVQSTAWPLTRNLGRGLPILGYPRGVSFTRRGHGWLWEARGPLVATSDGGRTWRDAGLTEYEWVEAVSASRVGQRLGYVLLRNGRKGGWELVRTRDAGRSWASVRLWRW